MGRRVRREGVASCEGEGENGEGERNLEDGGRGSIGCSVVRVTVLIGGVRQLGLGFTVLLIGGVRQLGLGFLTLLEPLERTGCTRGFAATCHVRGDARVEPVRDGLRLGLRGVRGRALMREHSLVVG